MGSSWVSELVADAYAELSLKIQANEEALDAGEPIPFPDIPVLPKEHRHPKLGIVFSNT